MEFTTPCFIRKNTQELRRGLEELGYEILTFGNTTLDAHNYDGNGSHKSIEEGRAILAFLMAILLVTIIISQSQKALCSFGMKIGIMQPLFQDVITRLP